MNATLNKVMLIGHLGDDVKMHYFNKFENNKPVVDNGFIVLEGRQTPMLKQIK